MNHQKSLIKVPETKLKHVYEWLCCKEEKLLYVNTIKYKKNNRIIVITDSAVALVAGKVFKGHIIRHSKPISDLKSIDYSNGVKVTLTFSERSFTIESQESRIIATLLLRQFAKLNFGEEMDPPTVTSDPPNAIGYRPETKRGSNWLLLKFLQQMRIMGLQYNADTKLINDYDSSPNGTFTLTSDSTFGACTAAFAHALAEDKTVKRLVFDSYQDVTQFLTAFISRSHSIQEISLTNYPEQIRGSFEISTVFDSQLKQFNFSKCQPNLVETVLKSCTNLKAKIDSIYIDNCPLPPSSMKGVTEALASISCFKEIQIISIDEPSNYQYSIPEFNRNFSQLTNLKQLKLSHFSIDGSSLFDMAVSQMPSLTSIDLSGNSFNEIPKIEKLTTSNLNLLMISNSQMSSKALKQILTILTQDDKTALTFVASNMSISKQIFSEFDFSGCKSVFNEFDWSGNLLTAEEASALFNFLRTQSYLKHISLSGCWTHETIEISNIFAKFAVEMGLSGLDIAQCPIDSASFFAAIDPLQSVKRINISGSLKGDDSLMEFSQFVQNHLSFEEIGCDKTEPTSLDGYVASILPILDMPNLQCFTHPEEDFYTLDVEPGNEPRALKRVVKLLKSKRPLTTPKERVARYLAAPTMKDSRKLRKSSSGEMRKAKINKVLSVAEIMGMMDTLVGMVATGAIIGNLNDPYQIGTSLLTDL